MQISRRDWENYINALARIDQTAADAMQYWMDDNPDADTDELIYTASLLSDRYGEAAASLACEMYDRTAAAQGVIVPPAEPAPTATYRETASAVGGTLKNKRNSVPQTVGRLVKQAGADTMLKNAMRDGAEFAWVPHGDTCSFCLMLASKGWTHATEGVAKGNHAEHIHANCDCTFAVRFDGKSGVKGYDPEKYRRMYEDAEGDTWQEKLNSMRRADYAERRDEINAQKRAAYAKNGKHESRGEKTVTEKPFLDLTGEWLGRTPTGPDVDLSPKTVLLNGIEYQVNGHSIKLMFSDIEREAASMMSSYTGQKATMMPRFSGDYRHIHSPDFILGEAEKWDHKELKGESKDAIRNAIKDKEEQAHRFVIEIGKYKRTDEDAISQAEKVFSSFNTKFVEALVLTKENRIIRVFFKKAQ